MANNYQWQFIRPLDQTAQIAALANGNQQITAGLQGIGSAITGYADQVKKDQTNTILNTLMQAQTTEQLPQAMQAVQALQEQYGRGFDQEAVRTAMDTRGSVLGQRDLQNINLQQAQAAQSAIPMLNQAGAQFFGNRTGLSAEQKTALEGLSAAGINTTDVMASLSNAGVGDFRDNRDNTFKVNSRNEDVQYRNEQAKIAQENADREYNFRTDESNWNRGGQIANENPGGSELIFKDGKWSTSTTPKVTRMDAYGALSAVDRIIGAESANNPNARNSKSTATGLGQFIESTWLDIVSRNRPDLVKGKSKGQILALRNNPDISRQMTEQYSKENADGLKRAGLPVTDGTIYLAHFAGLGGAKNLLKANPNASAESVLGSKVANANGKIVKGKTVGEVINWASNKMGGGKGSTPAGKSTAAAATNAIKLPQAVAAQAVSGYSSAITELQNNFNLATTKDAARTGMGTKGQTIDSWLTAKTTKEREGSTLITNYSAKVAKLARNNAKLSNLPMDDQLKILDAAHSWTLTPGGVITDKELNKHISNLATKLADGKKKEFEQSKKNIFETQYQAFVKQLNASGMPAVSRDAFKSLVNAK